MTASSSRLQESAISWVAATQASKMSSGRPKVLAVPPLISGSTRRWHGECRSIRRVWCGSDAGHDVAQAVFIGVGIVGIVGEGA